MDYPMRFARSVCGAYTSGLHVFYFNGIILVMTSYLKNIAKIAAVPYLAAAFLAVGIFSIGLMHHEGPMDETFNIMASCDSAVCGMPYDDFSCLDHCLSAVQNFTRAIAVSSALRPLLLLDLGLVAGFLFPFIRKLLIDRKLSKSRLRQLYEKAVSAFAGQLGFWLTIFEKRDPSHVPVLT